MLERSFMDVLSYTGMQHEQIFESLKTSAHGLSNNETQKRLQEYGPNKVNAQNPFFINFFYKNLTSYYMYLLLGSALIAFFLGEYLEGIMIIIFILINVSFSFYVEYKAHKASELLQTFLKSYSKVMHDRKITVVETSELVP